jgi:ligand-binding sensor domain-containing protein
MYRTFAALWFALFAIAPLIAQQPFFKNYQIKDGLLSNYIYSVFQDSKGYIWVSSDVGISRFDGQTFSNYNTAHGMPDNEVFSMYEARDGRLWFATLRGKPCFYYRDSIFSENNLSFLKRCDVQGMIINIIELEDGRIAYCSTHKVLIIDLLRQKVEERSCGEGIILAWKNQGDNLMGAGRAFGRITKNGIQSEMTPPIILQPARALPVGDSVLISSSNKLYSCFPTRELFQYRELPSPLGKNNEFIYLRRSGSQLWCGTRSGVYLLDYPSMRVNRYFLSGRSVSSVLEDREGGLWFSTFEEGLFYVPAPNIQHFTTQDGLIFNRITCLSQDAQHRLWIGSESSAYSIYDGKKMQSRQIFPENVKNKNIRNIRHFADGTTLVIGKAATLYLHEGVEKYLCHRSLDVNIDQRGDYWAGMTGLYHLDQKILPSVLLSQQTLYRFGLDSLYSRVKINRLPGIRVERIVFDENNHKWLATPNGLYSFKGKETEKKILPYGIKDLDFDAQTQNLWVLTESKGLFVIRHGQLIDSIAIANKRGGVICWDLCRDQNNEIWIGTAGGLFRVIGKPGKLKLVDYWGVLGLGSEKINAIEVTQDYIYIGKDDGLLQVPREVLASPSPPPVVLLKSLRINNIVQSISAKKAIPLQYSQGPLSIEYEGLSYRESLNIRYRYRLLGLDDKWYETAVEAVEYVNLQPGYYTFEVIALNGSGAASVRSSQLRLRIKPPFWRENWFYVLLTALIILAIVWYVRAREQKLRRKYEIENLLMKSSRENSELQKRISDLRMLALRLQMNPHFIFNALNTIKGYYGQEKVVEANSFIGKFARLLRLNLDYSDSLIPLEQEMDLLRIYVQLSQIRYPDKLKLDMQIAPELNPAEMLIPSMLIQPFVENAVIHGVIPKKGKGIIQVVFSVQNQDLVVRVKDDGVGRAASGQHKLRDMHKPLATQITNDRLKLLGQTEKTPIQILDLVDEQGHAQGTEVILLIPFQRKKML